MNNNNNQKQDASGRMDNNSRNEEQDSNSTPIYTTDNSTLQTPEEHKHDEGVDPRKNSKIDVSNDDLRETNADKFVGSDRAETAERKDNSV